MRIFIISAKIAASMNALLLLSQVTSFPKFSDTTYSDLWKNVDWDEVAVKWDPPLKHLSLLGVVLNQSKFEDVHRKLDKSVIYGQAESSASDPKQTCYKSSVAGDDTVVIFGSDVAGGWEWVNELILGKYHDNDPNYIYCVSTSKVHNNIAIDGGIKLGISPSRFNEIMGSPGHIINGEHVWCYDTMKPLPKNPVTQLFNSQIEQYNLIKDDCSEMKRGISTCIHARYDNNMLVWILIGQYADLRCDSR